MLKHLVLITAMIAAATSTAAQSAITGRVVADQSGEPLPNVRILLNMPEANDRVLVLTDRDGRFTLPAPPGKHNVAVSKTRFARSEVTASPGTAVEVRLRPGAAVSGRVVDEAGDPVVMARVTVESLRGPSTVVASVDTDDRGEYRLGGLSAGTFAVAVTTMGPMVAQARGPQLVTMMPEQVKTFYPNALASDGAEAIRLEWGDDRAGIDLVLPFNRAGIVPFDNWRGGLTAVQFAAITRGARPPEPPVAPSAVIRGRVVSRNGAALPYASVRLDRGANPLSPPVTRAGSDGRFEFRDLPEGAHRVSASKVGYFGAETSLEMKTSQVRDDVTVTLDPWGVLAGRVFDEHGEPVQGAKVDLLQIRYEAGRRRLVPASGVVRTTDDSGSYRLFALRPGQYIVSAEVGAIAAADLPGYARTFYPGTPVPAGAQFVEIGRFPELSGIDFSLSRARTASVTGRFINSDGEPGGGSLTLKPSQHSLSAIGVSIGARIYANGAFEFPNVPPGEYVIQANRGRLNSWTEGEFGAARVSVVDSDVDGVVVRTSKGSSIRGRVLFESYLDSKRPAPSAIELSPIPVDADLSPPNNFATANIGPDGSFVIEGINGPRRLEVIAVPTGWMLKDIRVGGVEITDRVLPFGKADDSLSNVEVALTDRVNRLSGSVRDDRARPASNASVIVFSTDRSQWYSRSRFVRRTRTGADGAFSIGGLPFASYYTVAVSDLPDDGDEAWQEPAFLESLIPRAVTALAGEGQAVSVNPRLVVR